jgi:uncharacterized membrane protein HdeD (DUF308 family)
MTDGGISGAPAHRRPEMASAVARNRSWFIAFGALLIVLGALAIVFPFATTIAAKIFLGWLLLIGGVGEVLHAFSSRDWKGFLANLLIGLLYIAVGGWLALFPLAGIITLTLLLAFFFILEGVLKLVMGFQLRPTGGWGWIVFSGAVAVLVGILLVAELPGTATWAIGLLVGVNLLMSGIAFVMLATRSGNV